MDAKLVGRLYSFIHTRGFGFIIVPNGTRTPRKFFLHISRVISGADNIAIGATVTFAVSDVKEGALPSAIDAEVSEVQS
jgi:cold shock CspA family protein